MRLSFIWNCPRALLRRQLTSPKASVFQRRCLAQSNVPSQEYVRNIGIIAHVDAGKTTTTERMLYYAGCTEQLGNVDRGDTVMDFLEEERDRGITISAAAITFTWRKREGSDDKSPRVPYFVNLIDTPGHVDFAVEVERSLFVLDGAVVILDASAGVEAQTLSVTQRAKSYKLPIIGFLNKLDKPTASVQLCVKSIQQQLGVVPLLLQLPVFDDKDRHRLVGLVDLVRMEAVQYNFDANTNGSIYERTPIPTKLKEAATEARRHLVESVANTDDAFAEEFLAIEDAASPQLNSKMVKSVIDACRKGRAMPIFVGSSLRNCGVQTLLDGIVDYLPSPVSKRNQVAKVFGNDASQIACGLIFKTVHDKVKGHLAYCRLYSGSIKRGSTLFLSSHIGNERIARMEKVLRVYKIMADELQEIEEAEWGGIVAITGLKQAATGMLLASRKLEQPEIDALSSIMPLSRLHIPPPVFSCTIEAETSSQQGQLESALQALAQEDPSITLSNIEDGSPLVISGLGELHLEVIKHRLEKESKLKTLFGPLQIAYVETISQPVRRLISEKVTVGGHTSSIAFDIEVRPSKNQPSASDMLSLTDSCPDVQVMKSSKDSQIDFIKPIELKALKLGLESACKAGPLLRSPIQPSFECRLFAFAVTPGSSMAIVTAAFSRGLRSLFADASPKLLEPHMRVEIQVESQFLSGILSDLAMRQAVIESVTHPLNEQQSESTDNRVFVRCTAPLRLLRGYATAARVLASGRISLAMELESYQPVTSQRDLDSIRSESGFVLPSQRSS